MPSETEVAINRITGANPSVTCLVCGRPRATCTTPGGEVCLTQSSHVDGFSIIKHLASEAEEWAKTAHSILQALEAAYAGKTLCGWCKEPIEVGAGPEHGRVCVKSPIGTRLRRLVEAAREVVRGSIPGERRDLDDLADAMRDAEIPIVSASAPKLPGY